MTKYWIYIIGAAVGGILGWLYWNFIGCDDSCHIWSSPTNSTLYGIALGAFGIGALKNIVSGRDE